MERAIMPRKTFVAGTLATASDVNTYLMDQSVMTFATATHCDRIGFCHAVFDAFVRAFRFVASK